MQVLGICCMSILLVSLDNTIVNVALPTIHRDLGASLSQLQWTVDAYTVVLATLLILSGSIADRIGRKRLRDRSRTLLARLALVQRCALTRLADRVPRCSGRGRVDAQPGRDVDHPECLHRST
jgi:MFS family permease